MIGVELQLYREGQISFDDFVRSTRADWQRIAAYLLRRWDAPCAVAVDDMVQELLLGCWTAVDRWEPTGGNSLKKFVVYQAVDKAAKWLHKQRRALRNDGRNPSRHALPFSAFAGKSGEAREIEAVAGTCAEDDTEERAARQHALESEDEVGQLIIAEFALGGAEQAAWALLSVQTAREAAHVSTHAAARKLVLERARDFLKKVA